jgi:hypothetical protein
MTGGEKGSAFIITVIKNRSIQDNEDKLKLWKCISTDRLATLAQSISVHTQWHGPQYVPHRNTLKSSPLNMQIFVLKNASTACGHAVTVT